MGKPRVFNAAQAATTHSHSLLGGAILTKIPWYPTVTFRGWGGNLSESIWQCLTGLHWVIPSESIWFIDVMLNKPSMDIVNHDFHHGTVTFLPHLVKFTKIVWFSWFSHHDSLGIPHDSTSSTITTGGWPFLYGNIFRKYSLVMTNRARHG